MRKALLQLLVALFATTAFQVMAEERSTTTSRFLNHFDIAQPAFVSVNGELRGAKDWLILGYHASACKVGRVSFCGLGLAWGASKQQDEYGWDLDDERWKNTLYITSPVSIRLAGDVDDNGFDVAFPELTIAPYYDALFERWGVTIGFSIGGR